jgi:hypothetical protein
MDINESILYIGNLVYAKGSAEDREAWQNLKSAALAKTSFPLLKEVQHHVNREMWTNMFRPDSSGTIELTYNYILKKIG